LIAQNQNNLFITGGTGFFGKALLRHWKRTRPSFKKIFILSRNPASFLKEYHGLIAELNVEFIQGDILEASKISLNENIDYVIHAATDSTIGPSLGRLEVFNQIAKGTEEVLKFVVNHHCKRFLLTSSGAVYGPQPQGMEKIPESYLGSPDPLGPNSAYGLGKKSAEHLCALYSEQHGLDYVIARCFAFVGEDLPLDAHFAVGNFIRDALSGKDINIFGDGTPLRSYMYQEDLANWLMEMLFKGKPGVAYNVGSDQAISIQDLATLIRELISPKSKIIIHSKEKSSFRNRYVPDVALARSELGLSLDFDLNKAIEQTIDNL